MKKPTKLVQLICDIDENFSDDGAVGGDAEAIIRFGKTSVQLVAFDLDRVLSSEANIRKMFETLGSPEDATIEFSDTTLSTEAYDTLNELFIEVSV